MNQLTITEFLLRALWRIKQSWHYLFAIAFTQILLFLYTDLTLKWALIAFVLLVACFALLNNPLEDQRPTTMSKSQSGKKKKGDRLQPFIELIEALPDPILLLNRHNKLIAANHQARNNFEIDNTGQDITAIIRTPDLLEAVSRTVSSHESERVLIQTRIPVERQYMVNLVWLANGEVRGPSLLIHFRDLSEQERLNRMRSDFIANASHELRTPLASLLGFIDTLQGPARNDEDARDKFLGVMAKQGKRMTRLIDDLLSLSRVEMNVHQHPSDRLDVTGLITHTIDILKPLAEGQGISLEWQPPEKSVETIGDRDELSQVFQNLIQNAIKYGQEGGYVKVSLRDANDGSMLRPRFAIDIEDNGIGIQSHHIPRLTERFYRVDVEQSREKGGTGLGLAIVKHILTHHRGELKIQSKPGAGSTFTIFLPKA